MTGPAALIGHSIRRVRTLVLAVALVLALFQLLLNLVAGSIQRSSMFEQVGMMIPTVVRQVIGTGFVEMLSFRGIVCVGYFHPIVMGALIGLAIALATQTAAEVESGFVDLVLSRPLARHWLVTRSAILIAGTVLFILAAMAAGTAAGLAWLAPPEVPGPGPRLIASLAINLGLLILCWGGLSLAIGARSRRRGAAGAVAGMAAFIAFLLDYLGRAWEPARAVAWISPFHYYGPVEIVTGVPIPAHHPWVLGGVALAGLAAAWAGVSRRDL